MNFGETLEKMLAAAATAAKSDWKKMRDFAEQEFRTLAANSHHLESEFLDDLAAAAILGKQSERAEAIRIAKLRLKHGFRGITRAAEAAMIVSAADVTLAAQNAINAAIGVLKAAINQSIGVAVL